MSIIIVQAVLSVIVCYCIASGIWLISGWDKVNLYMPKPIFIAVLYAIGFIALKFMFKL